MYTLVRAISTRQLLLEQAPAFGASLIIAELFYRFHSFTLECVAFLITWFLLDAAVGHERTLVPATPVFCATPDGGAGEISRV